MLPTDRATAPIRFAVVSQAWTVIVEAQEDIAAGVPVRHDAELVFLARGLIAEEFDTDDQGAWNLVAESTTAGEADRAAFLAGQSSETPTD